MIFEKSSLPCSSSVTHVHSEQPDVHQIVLTNDYKGNEIEIELYELNLDIDVSNEEFTTDTKIKFKVLNSRQFLVLKNGNYDITSIVMKKGRTDLRLEGIIDYKPTQSLILHLEQKLSPNDYVLIIKTKGQINKDLVGLCCITMKESNSYLYITQLRPNNAQLLFPCFDQANLLACFQLNLVTSSKQFLKPASNTRAEKFITDFPEENLTTVAFIKTTRMHPSKFFLALGNYVHSEPYVTKSGFLIVIISRPEIYDNVKEVPKLIKAIIETLTKYFNCPVPSNTLDVILVPKKWPSMACAGNPGILVCEEYLLTNLKKKTCIEFVKSITFLVHELCHLWLGGDVTVDNWNDIWILEGIVSVIAHECSELMFSQWYDEWIPLMYQLFPLLNFESDINTVFNKQDAILSHVFSESSHEEFINAKCKSLALFRMIWSVSPTSFRVVLVNMINRKEKINYLPLWKEIFAENSPEEFLEEWKENKKYPVISLRTTYKDNSQILTQAPFKKLTEENIDEKTTWTIPIKYIDLKNPQNVLNVWFSNKATEAHIQNIKGKWIKLNWHQRGFYRVNYTYDQWAHFTEMLNKNPLLLDHQDRANLVDDAFTLAAANYFQYHIPLDLSSYITHGEERHYLPLAISFRYLRKLYLFFHGSEYQGSLQRYIHHFLDKYLAQNVWKVNMKSPTETLRRVEVIHTACWSAHQPVLDKIKDLFLDWLEEKENQNLHVDLLNNVVKYGLAGTDDKDLWRHVFHVFKSSKNLHLRSRLWSTLSKTKDEAFLRGMINAFISKGYPLEKTLERLKDTADNPLAAGMIMDYIFTNIPALFIVTNKEAIKALECLKKIVYYKNDEESMAQIAKYVKPMEHLAQAREIGETIAEMRCWQEKQADVVKEWLYHFFNQ